MSNEIQVRSGLTIRKGQLASGAYQIDYRGQSSFNDDMTGELGPTPGAFTAAVTGTAADLSKLTNPGWATLKNLDDTNFVTWGIRDPDTGNFFPVGELKAGQSVVLLLSRYLLQEFTGTGTPGTTNQQLYFMADTAAVVVSVEAFER